MKLDLPGYGTLTEPYDNTEYYATSLAGDRIWCQECRHRADYAYNKSLKWVEAQDVDTDAKCIKCEACVLSN